MSEPMKYPSIGWIGLLLLVLPFLYVLLTGPAIGLVRSERFGYHRPQWLKEAFDPAVIVASDTILEKPLDGYVDWWTEVLKPKEPVVMLYR
jgi:hypothetical protein